MEITAAWKLHVQKCNIVVFEVYGVSSAQHTAVVNMSQVLSVTHWQQKQSPATFVPCKFIVLTGLPQDCQ